MIMAVQVYIRLGSIRLVCLTSTTARRYLV